MKSANKYDKTINLLKNNFVIVLAILMFVSITASAELISSIESIRHFVIGDHLMINSVEEIELTTDLTPNILSDKYVIGKNPPYDFPDRIVTWKAEIQEDNRENSENILLVKSENIMMNLYISNFG
jgi:hypothetical protein